MGPASLQATITVQQDRWQVSELKAELGRSDMAGEVSISLAELPSVRLDLASDTLDVAGLLAPRADRTGTVSRDHESPADIVELPVPRLPGPERVRDLNGKARFRVRRLLLPDATLEDLEIEAVANQGRVRVNPIAVKLGGGAIDAQLELDLAAPGIAGSLDMNVHGIDLGELLGPREGDAVRLGTLSGHAGLSLPAGTSVGERDLTVDALLERLRIADVSLRYDDPALEAQTDQRLTAQSFAEPARVSGTVALRGNPLRVSLETGPLRQVLDDPGTLSLRATAQANGNVVRVETTVDRLLPIESLGATIAAKGPNPAGLGEAVGIPLPNLPPYQLRSELRREPGPGGTDHWALERLGGQVGDSDVAGEMRVTLGGRRPELLARLHSSILDFDDLGGLIGAAPDPDETASPAQVQRAEALDGRRKVLPNKPIRFDKLRALDADVEYRAKRIQAPSLPLDDVAIKATLEDGYLKVRTLDFGVADGTVSMTLDVNAREAPVRAKLDGDFDRVKLNEIVGAFEMADDTFGAVGGRATLWMRGDTLAQWLGSADGGLYLTMTGGKVDALLIEAAGLDFLEAAAVFLGPETETRIQCAYADLQARSGTLTLDPLLLDTRDTKFKGFGTIDLSRERLDLTIEPYPQDFTLLSSRGPLQVAGSFAEPSFGVDPSFPSPELGTADDSARCSGLVEALREARTQRREGRE